MSLQPDVPGSACPETPTVATTKDSPAVETSNSVCSVPVNPTPVPLLFSSTKPIVAAARTRTVFTQTDSLQNFLTAEHIGNQDIADVEIVIECNQFPSQRASFKAHRQVLALRNKRFKAELYGNGADDKDRLFITHLHPDGVAGLVRFLYSGHPELETVHQAARVRTAAVNYDVPDLADKCLAYVKRHMKTDDVCLYLDYVLTTREREMLAPADKFLYAYGQAVLASSAFEKSMEHTVNYVLDHVQCFDELKVLEAVRAWSQEQCLNNKAGNPLVLRAVMQPLFSKLRFLALTVKEFVRGPNKWGILNDDEARALMSNIVEEGSLPLPPGFCKSRARRTDWNFVAVDPNKCLD